MLLLAAGLVLTGCSGNNEGIVAEVNGQQITQEEFDKDFQVFRDIYERQLGEGALEQEGIDGRTMGENLKVSILDKLIMEIVIQQDSISKGINLTEEEIEEYIEDYKESVGGEEGYQQFLQSNRLTEEYFRENMRKDLMVERHKSDIQEGVAVTADDVREYFDSNGEMLVEINASHILLGNQEDAQRVLQMLESGESFSDLAMMESLDSVSAVNGGNLGYFGRGQMISEFEDAAFALQEGEISEIIRTEVGFHIIQVLNRRDSFDELEDKIITMIKEEAYFDYIQSLMDKATIERYLD